MKASSTRLLTAVLVVALLAGSGVCVALRHSADERRDEESRALAASLSPGSQDKVTERGAAESGPAPTRIGDRAAFQQRLSSLLTTGDPIARTQDLLGMIDGLNPADFPAFYEEMKKICKNGGDPTYGDPMLLLVLAAWAEVDPETALQEELKEKLFRDSTALKVWVERDPTRALAWLKENGKSAALVGQALRILVSHDPETALAWAMRHDAGDRDHGALGIVLKGMLPKHLKEVIREFSQLPVETRRSVIVPLGAEIGRLSAEEQREWLESFSPGEARDEAVAAMVSGMKTLDERLKLLADYPGALNRPGAGQIYEQWMAQNYEAALESLGKLPKGANKNAAVAASVDGLIYKGQPRQALEVMNRNPESVDKWLLLQWMEVATNNQKEWDLALSTIERVGNQESREFLYRETLDRWLTYNRKAARDWIDSHGELPESVRAELEHR